jgi:low affinity Fe/Cu permease
LYAYKEQVVLGTIQGSAAFLSPFLYGSSNGITIGKLHSFSNEYATGSAVIKNQMLYLLQNSIVADKIHYQKGKYYTQDGTGADDRVVASGANKFIHLSKKNGKTVSSITSNAVHLKVGDKLAIVRKSTKDSSAYFYRILIFTQHPILDYSHTYMTAKKTGKEIWQFEPDAYMDSQKVTITVTK